MSSGFAAIVSVKLKPEMMERYLALASEVGEAMSQEEEFKHAWVHTLADDPTTVVVYEAWSCTIEYFMRELMTKPYRHRFEAELGDMSSVERRIEILNYAISYPG